MTKFVLFGGIILTLFRTGSWWLKLDDNDQAMSADSCWSTVKRKWYLWLEFVYTRGIPDIGNTEQVETLAIFRHMPQFPDLSEVWFCSILFLPRTWNFLENNKEFFSAQLYSHILSIFLYQLMTLLSHFETLLCIFVRDGYTLAFSGASTVVVIPSNFIHSFFFLSNLTNFQLSPFCPKQRIFPDID
jgi:hypothetical protein